MTKLVIFDLDGVLVDSTHIHYEALNTALREIAGELFTISQKEHENKYNGLSTRTKLNMILSDVSLHEPVFKRKQELTTQLMKNIPTRHDLYSTLEDIRSRGISIWCASNCIQNTVENALKSMGIITLFDGILSNESVTHPKPYPDIYNECMKRACVSSEETLIFEDSFIGLQSAIRSGARVWKVSSPSELTFDFINEAIQSTYSNLMRHVNIVIPMAGNGSRFVNAGYKDPKPFIPVFGSPMVSWVTRNLGIDGHYTFIISKKLDEEYNATTYLKSLCADSSIISIDKVTEGAACTVLLAKEQIDNQNPLIIINSDQYIEFKEGNTAFDFVFKFLYDPNECEMTGKISTFDGNYNPKWSYAKLDTDGTVTEVREKDPFSEHATTGLYMWKHGCDFVKYANQMIEKNIRVNNEFYVVPVFNEAILDKHKICISDCKRMWGLGVPEDLEFFLNNFK
jgi:HAD superfamily hydrolase (TIGR01509 family)